MRQHDITCRIMDEERLWLAEYNRDVNGEINLIDPDNGQPIPHTAGMIQICRESNYDTYGEVLTLNKIERTIGDILDKDTDTGSMEVVLMGGKGFMEDFDQAIRNDARSEGFATPLGDKMIEDFNGGLSYGKYFRRYKTVDGHVITVQHLPFLDHGTLAENAKAKCGVLKGLTDIPAAWGSVPTNSISTDVDMSRYEIKNSYGLQVNNATKMLQLKCVI